ncbi:MAG TPA: peptidoglycan-binding domain-containing protein [Xanthobacteraceae bacterium]|nr:peptidoglycan-binding domain-containing protein [Xanthobacteraceae bacterium]
MRDSFNHQNLMARREPNFDDMFKAPRRKRKPPETGIVTRFSKRGMADLVAGIAAAAAIVFVFVNALALQKAPAAVRAASQAAPKSASGSAPLAAPLPPPRPDAGNRRSRNDLVHDVQQELASRGYYDGGVDGNTGPRIAQAIRAFEESQRLRVTGEPSEALLEQIRKAPGKSDVTGSIPSSNPVKGNPQLLSVQRLLARYGYGPVRASGTADQQTHEAIARFELDRNIPQTGEVSERLLQELAAYGGGTLD